MDEGRLLLGYVFSGSPAHWSPASGDVARYQEALRIQLAGKSHALDPIFFRFPVLLGGLDCATRMLYPQSPFRQKLVVAAALIECHPVSAGWLLPKDRGFIVLVANAIRLFLRSLAKALLALPLLFSPEFLRRNAGE